MFRRPRIVVPNPEISAREIRALVAEPALRRDRSPRGQAVLAYIQAPCTTHPELVQDPPLARQLRDATGEILRRSDLDWIIATIRRQTDRIEASEIPQLADLRCRALDLSDWLRFVMVGLYGELLTGRPLRSEEWRTLYDTGTDLEATLKATGRRDLARRWPAYRLVERWIDAGQIPTLRDRCELDPRQWAHYIIGNFFQTGVLQILETQSHLFRNVWDHERGSFVDAALKLPEDYDGRALLDTAIFSQCLEETMRLQPTTGTLWRSFRKSREVLGRQWSAGTRLRFDVTACQSLGMSEPERFRPERWSFDPTLSRHTPRCKPAEGAPYFPFGHGKYKCPAENFARCCTVAGVVELVRRFDITVAPNAVHDRMLARGTSVVMMARATSGSLRPEERTHALQRATAHADRFRFTGSVYGDFPTNLIRIARDVWRARRFDPCVWHALANSLGANLLGWKWQLFPQTRGDHRESLT